jgi:hypothetical protein
MDLLVYDPPYQPYWRFAMEFHRYCFQCELHLLLPVLARLGLCIIEVKNMHSIIANTTPNN